MKHTCLLSKLLFYGVTLVLLAGSSIASPISDKYTQLGGAAGFLGAPTIAETTTPDKECN